MRRARSLAAILMALLLIGAFAWRALAALREGSSRRGGMILLRSR